MYVYIQSEKESNVWNVGFYNPTGSFILESQHSTSEKAAERVSFLNGGKTEATQDMLAQYEFIQQSYGSMLDCIQQMYAKMEESEVINNGQTESLAELLVLVFQFHNNVAVLEHRIQKLEDPKGVPCDTTLLS